MILIFENVEYETTIQKMILQIDSTTIISCKCKDILRNKPPPYCNRINDMCGYDNMSFIDLYYYQLIIETDNKNYNINFFFEGDRTNAIDYIYDVMHLSRNKDFYLK